jgi:putative ABC transport system permease protein
METLIRDVKQALRMFRDSPAFTATAVIALMLGIGVNTAIFTVVNAILIKPIPFPEPERLVFVMNGEVRRATAAHFTHWRAQTEVLEDVAAWRNLPLSYTAGDRIETVQAGTVSADYFRVLRAPFAAGRGFSAEDDRPGAAGTAVISQNFWTRRLGGDRDVLGKTLSVGGRAYTVVGIAGRDFDVREFGEPELWVPLQIDPNATDDAMALQVFARLRDSVTLEQAQARLAASVAEYRERFPNAFDVEHDETGFTALPVHEALVGNARSTLLVLAGAVGLVLLIACANVANLLLVRATRREREIAIRSALGAARGRIVRQLLTESVLLALMGGALGLVAGFLGVRALLSINTADLPRLGDAASLLGLDWRVAGFALGLSILTGLLFGLLPALVSSRTDLNAVINHSSGRSGSGFRQNRTRSFLVAAEVGLAVVLAIGVGLLIRTMLALGTVNLGFSTENLLSMHTWLSDPRFSATASVTQTTRTALERVQSLPGVEAAASTCCVPTQNVIDLPFDIVGRDDEATFTGIASTLPSSPGYFETLRIPLLAGRAFDARDDAGAPPVIMINQAMADQFWADGRNPFQDLIRIGAGVVPEVADEPARQIIGIVGNVRELGIYRNAAPAVYVPQAQLPDAVTSQILRNAPMAWIVRTSVPPGTVSAAIREELTQVTGEPTTDVLVMDNLFATITSRHRLNAWLMSVFGGAALLLAAVGVYGLIAYAVEQRRQEIGIRMALGAEAVSLRSMVIRQGMLPVVTGVGAGLVAAYFLANVLASTLFGVEPRDLSVFVTVAVALTVVGLAAVSVPALRASRVDPTAALRSS